ncbi:metallothionein-like protein 4B [Cornus florida]|uniref:metallothionein-like protein 4B n=1 Tax=Cornus florida TaxID=4283 RepID=UPI00289E8392|nr:metallothionein-like protein 4B [Cornus florida]
MTDAREELRRGAMVCNDRCGCPSPCPGGIACRCTNSGVSSGGAGVEHKRCSCGDHCGCNPCTCTKTEMTGTGKVLCKCGDGCTCVTCAS